MTGAAARCSFHDIFGYGSGDYCKTMKWAYSEKAVSFFPIVELLSPKPADTLVKGKTFSSRSFL